MFCTNCGHKSNKEKNFCTNCGKKFIEKKNVYNCKKLGLIIIAVASIVMSLSSISMISLFSEMYGNGMYYTILVAIDIALVSVAYYFSTKNMIGPIIGLVYVVWGMINNTANITNLFLCIGYTLILVHYVSEKKLPQESTFIDSDI